MANTQTIDLTELQEKLLTMASHAEAAVNHAVKALLRRDDELARRTREDDSLIDALEMEIDESAIGLLARQPAAFELRLITTAMKISHDLERVGDEATTISRRCLELSLEPPLRHTEKIPQLAAPALALLKEALDTFVNQDPAKARQLIPQDEAIDQLHKELHRELVAYMREQPEAIKRALSLMVVAKCLERIADHATNIAEMVVFLCEGRDIRHTGIKSAGRKQR